MRNLVLVSMLAVVCHPIKAVADDFFKMPVKSGIVEYQLTGSREGTETWYFDHHGQKQARYTSGVMRVLGMVSKVEEVHYMDGQWAYSYDPKTKKAIRLNTKEIMKRMKNTPGFQSYSEDFLREMGARKLGSKQVIGRPCDIWSMKDEQMALTVCVYKGAVTLESEGSIMGITMKSAATKFQENVGVPADKISLPAAAQIEDAPQIDFRHVQESMNGMNQKMPAAQATMTQAEIELKQRELELKMKELQLKEQQMNEEQMPQNQEQQKPRQKSALEQAEDAVRKTERANNTARKIKSLLGW